ncbi:hypothetical protein CPB86DRAFT_793375 [Serendipita vermifera]|nr:hypothetical protein CPB86DRAFT_793375 [Serendipita vermifera]
MGVRIGKYIGKNANWIKKRIAVAGALGLVRDMKKSFFDSLADTMHFWFATTDSEATRKLRSISRPRSVWVVDTIPSREHSTLLQLIAFYVRQKGLTVVFSAGFPAFVKWPDIEGIFGEFGKSWRSGGYRRDDVHLKATTHSNRHDPERKNDPPIGELLKRTPSRWAESYSMKALRPQGISSTGIIYLPEEFRDDLKRFLDDPEEFRDLKELDSIGHLEAPIVFSKVGRGWLGYIGDVNDEQTSDAVLTAMLDIHR